MSIVGISQKPLPGWSGILFSHTARKTEPGQYVQECRGREVLRFQYQVVQLSRLRWRDFLRQKNPVACALMSRMQIERRDRPKVKAQCLRWLLPLSLDRAKMGLIAGFVDAYLRLSEAEKARTVDEVLTHLP